MGRAGFTLIELLVVMAILGVMIAVMPMVARGVLPSLQVRADAREIAASLRQARAEAIRDNRETAVLFDVEAGRYGRPGAASAGELGRGVAMRLTTARREVLGEGLGRIAFYPDGASSGGEVTLSADGESYLVAIDWFTGRIQVAD